MIRHLRVAPTGGPRPAIGRTTRTKSTTGGGRSGRPGHWARHCWRAARARRSRRSLPGRRVPRATPAGTVVIDTAGRKLYYVINATSAYRYPISVGRDGFTWTGTEKISRVADWPDWHPPKEMRERDASLPEKMTGGLRNPLGAKALYLGNSLYRIHGTNDLKTIGYAASSGCFRMMNHHVVHLASLAGVGTTVHVVRSLSRGGGVAANTEAR